MNVPSDPMAQENPPPFPTLMRHALRYSMPVAMGYIPAGFAFGVLMHTAGLPWWLSLAMSVILYSGAAQYASIPLFAAGAGPVTLTINALVINLRHIFYGLPLLPDLPLKKPARLYALFALTDESFSVLTTLPQPLRRPLFVPITALNQFYWCAATVAGSAAGAGVGNMIPHLDFALVCLFVILGYEQFVSKKILWPCVPALFAFAAAKFLVPQYALLAAVGFCAAVIAANSMTPRTRTRKRP